MHERLHAVEVLKRGVLRSGREDVDAKLRERINHGPCLDAAGEENRPLPGEPLAVRRQFSAAGFFAFGDKRLDPLLHDPLLQAVHLVVQFAGDVAKRLRHVGHAVEGFLKVRDAVILLHLLGEVGEAFGTYDDVQLRTVCVAQVLEFGVAADAGKDADAEPVKERQHSPEVTGDVVLADQVDVVVGGVFGFGRADHVFEEGLTRKAVADVLVADETGSVHRDHRYAHLFAGRLADRLDVVAGHGGDTGCVDEDRLRLRVARREFLDGAVELLLAAEDHVVLQHLGGEAATVYLGVGGTRAAVVPGVSGAGDGTVHQVNDVSYGHEDDARAVVGAAALGPFARFGFLAELGSPGVVCLAICRVVPIRLRHWSLLFVCGLRWAVLVSSPTKANPPCPPFAKGGNVGLVQRIWQLNSSVRNSSCYEKFASPLLNKQAYKLPPLRRGAGGGFAFYWHA